MSEPHDFIMDAPIRARYLHDAHLAALLLVFFLAMAAQPAWPVVLAWALMFAAIAIRCGLAWRRLLVYAVWAVVLASSIGLLQWLHAGRDDVAWRHVAVRVWGMTWVALSTAQLIRPHDVMVYLMQRRWLPLRVGYAMLIGFGSIDWLRAEWGRIRLNARLRGVPRRHIAFMWLPLLVFALRHAQRSAMSLRLRGLALRKTHALNDRSSTRQRQHAWIWAVLMLAVGAAAYGLALGLRA